MGRRLGWICAAMALGGALPATALSQGQSEASGSSGSTGDASAQRSDASSKGKAGKGQRLSGEKRQQALDLLKVKSEEMKELQAKATSVTLEVGRLASTGKLPQDKDSLAEMQRMVDELKAIRQRLDALEGEIEGIQGWIEGQSEALPIMAQDISALKAHRVGNYIQFQFQDTNQAGGASDAFRLRRVRIGFTDTIAPNASFKISFDGATGTNQQNFQLKDAFVTYEVAASDVTVGTWVRGGQQPMPLGYELERSSSDREFPERARYNQVMFNGERNRGVLITHGIGKNALVQIGGWNALTVNDPEQINLAPGPNSRLGMSAGIRFFGNRIDLGLSGFKSTRPPFSSGTPVVTSPQVNREFIYLDANVVGVGLPNLWFRGEAMVGKDRVPNATAAVTRVQRNMLGWHTILGYNINYRNQIAVRFEQFDPNRDAGGDLFNGWGVAYNYFTNPNARLTAAYESFSDDARALAPISQKHYKALTFRMQYKF